MKLYPLPPELESSDVYGDKAPFLDGLVFKLIDVRTFKINSHNSYVGVYEGTKQNKSYFLFGSTSGDKYHLDEVIKDYVIGPNKKENMSIDRIKNMSDLEKNYAKILSYHLNYVKLLSDSGLLYKKRDPSRDGSLVIYMSDYLKQKEDESKDDIVVNYD